MIKVLTTVFLVMCSAALLTAQRPAPDTVLLGKIRLVVHPVYHGALVLEWGETIVYVDPYGGPAAYEGLKAPDLVLITDIHADHLDTNTLSGIDMSGAHVVMPPAVFDIFPARFKRKHSVSLRNGNTDQSTRISVQAIPMYNLPEDASSRHVKGRGNGYVLTLDQKRVYISGDTEDIPEMRRLRNIDVAFVCMNLPYTMGIDQAASAVLEFKPRIVYPYHYRGKEGMSDTKGFSDLVNKGNTAIDVRLRNWYAVRQ